MNYLRLSSYACMVGALCLFGGMPAANAFEDNRTQPAQRSDDAQASSAKVGPTASAEATLALGLLGSLTPDHMKQFGQMLEQDWKKRPEWGDMAIAILKGEKMRIGTGWWQPGLKRYDWSWLRGGFDGNRDGQVDRDEIPEIGLTDKLFARLDGDGDGKLSEADFDGTDSGPGSMANMMSSVLFSRLDSDSNGRISLEELAEFFARSDSEKLGFLTREDLRAGLDDPESRGQPSRGQGGEPPPAVMLRMFLTGQLGWLEAGPGYGDLAPDFTLPTHDGASTVTLSDSRGKKPVVLIFGSFT